MDLQVFMCFSLLLIHSLFSFLSPLFSSLMEDVDIILLNIFRDLGFSLSPNDSLKSFDSERFFSVTKLALDSIHHANGSQPPVLPKSLPQPKAARYRVCSSAASAVRDLGYSGEVGYEIFLYPNEFEVRRLLQFLVNKLPKNVERPEKSNDSSAVPGSSAYCFNSFINTRWSPLDVLSSCEQPNFPYVSQLIVPPNALSRLSPLPSSSSSSLSYYHSSSHPVLFSQVRSPAAFVSSLLVCSHQEVLAQAEREKKWHENNSTNQRNERDRSLNSLLVGAFKNAARIRSLNADKSLGFGSLLSGSGTSTAFTRKTQFEQEKQKVQQVQEIKVKSEDEEKKREEELKEERETQLKALQEELERMASQSKAMDLKSDQLSATARQSEAELHSLSSTTQQLEDAYKVRKRTIDLLPEAAKNMSELSRLVEASSQRLVELAGEWEKHRQPLLEKLRKAKAALGERKEDVVRKLTQIKRMREEMKSAAEDIREKEKGQKELTEELAGMPKSINRQVYVRRIMDIMRNLDKQKQEIKKILGDVRNVQKEINVVSEASKRSFAVADELVFQAAKKNTTDLLIARAYKMLVELRDGFLELVRGVEEAGRVQNEIRELSAQIEDIETRNAAMNTEQLQTDLAQVKKENKTLQTKLKGAK
jgi:hypothetical protein